MSAAAAVAAIDRRVGVTGCCGRRMTAHSFAWGFVGPGHASDGHTFDTGYGPEEAAAGAEMLVLRARGIGGFRGLLLGSVSGQCRHHAPAPLTIVRCDGGGLPRH